MKILNINFLNTHSKTIKFLILFILYNFNLFAGDVLQSNIQKEHNNIYFYKLEHPEIPLAPIYLLGSNHAVPADVLPDFVHKYFSACPLFIHEIENTLDYNNLFETYKQSGYGYNILRILEKGLQPPLPSVSKIAQQILDENSNLSVPQLTPMQQSQLLVDNVIKYYSKGWIQDLKEIDLLKEFAIKHNLSYETLNSIDPIALMHILSNEIDISINQNGMDAYFTRQAQIEGKDCKVLETQYDRFQLSGKFRHGDILALLDFSSVLDSIDKYLISCFPKTEQDKIDYNNNEKKSINIYIEDYLKNEHHDEIYGDLLKNNDQYNLIERNRLWAAKFVDINQPTFVCIGHAHLCGPDSFINLMKQKGYQVKQATHQGF